MKESFRYAALELALMTTIVVSANGSAEDSITGTVSAIVNTPVNVSNTASTISSSTLVSDDCLQNARTLAICTNRIDEDGMLKGDPVSNIMLNFGEGSLFPKHDVRVIVTYN